MRKPEIRNPKSEGSPNPEERRHCDREGGLPISEFGIRNSEFGLGR